MKPKTFKLTKEEQWIEDHAHEFVPASKETLARLDRAIALHKRQKKNKNISLRISEGDLSGIKKVAAKEGMPYQTLITSVLHKFLTRQLVDRNTV